MPVVGVHGRPTNDHIKSNVLRVALAFTAAMLGPAAARAQTPSGPPFPRLANMYLQGGIDPADIPALAKWDVLIFDIARESADHVTKVDAPRRQPPLSPSIAAHELHIGLALFGILLNIEEEHADRRPRQRTDPLIRGSVELHVDVDGIDSTIAVYQLTNRLMNVVQHFRPLQAWWTFLSTLQSRIPSAVFRVLRIRIARRVRHETYRRVHSCQQQ